MRKESAPSDILIICNDITTHKKAKNDLKLSEDKFHQITESIGEIFWIVSPEMDKIIYVSPAYKRVWGRTCQSLYDNPKSWMDAIHPEDRDRTVKMISDELDKSDDVIGGFEYRIIRPDGEISWIWTQAFRIKDESGEISRITGITSEITGYKKQKKKLKLF